ncbi:hypothetical protein QE152_g35824 [Popillia japonica]|uniref:Uncharacterized protein n=1 Tax=Popillia japonica TaxID=7064 RepID=A0AAW1IEX1_POPJA
MLEELEDKEVIVEGGICKCISYLINGSLLYRYLHIYSFTVIVTKYTLGLQYGCTTKYKCRWSCTCLFSSEKA